MEIYICIYFWSRRFFSSKEICQSFENHGEHAQNANNTREQQCFADSIIFFICYIVRFSNSFETIKIKGMKSQLWVRLATSFRLIFLLSVANFTLLGCLVAVRYCRLLLFCCGILIFIKSHKRIFTPLKDFLYDYSSLLSQCGNSDVELFHVCHHISHREASYFIL